MTPRTQTPIQLSKWSLLLRNRTLPAIILVALLMYLARLPTFQVGTYTDDAWYITLAKSLSSGQGYRRIELVGAPLTTAVPFGYPLMLAPLVYLFPGTFLPLQLLSTFLAIGTIYFFRNFLRSRSCPRVTVLLLLLLSFHPGVVAHASMVMSEMAYIFFTMMALYFVDRYESEKNVVTRSLVALSFSAAMSYFVRVIGIVLVTSIVIYFLLRRQLLKAAILGFTLSLPIGLWSYRNWIVAGALISKEYEEARFTSSAVAYLNSLRSTVGDFLFDLSHTVIPFLGPRTMSLLNGLSIWLPDVFNIAVGATIFFGWLHSVRRMRGVAELYVVSSMVVLLAFANYSYDRYLMPLVPFLYFYLFVGIGLISDLVLSRIHVSRFSIRRAQVVTLCAVGILLLNAARDVQGIVDPARRHIPDVSLGATWIRDHTPPDAVIMARVPRVTFIYAERASVPYPDDSWDSRNFYGTLPGIDPGEVLINNIETFKVNYLLIAPPIRFSTGIFVPELDEYTKNVVLTTIDDHRERFKLVYNNPQQKVFVYEVRH